MQTIEHIVVILGYSLFHTNNGDLVWDPNARRVSNVVFIVLIFGPNNSPDYYIGNLLGGNKLD